MFICHCQKKASDLQKDCLSVQCQVLTQNVHCWKMLYEITFIMLAQFIRGKLRIVLPLAIPLRLQVRAAMRVFHSASTSLMLPPCNTKQVLLNSHLLVQIKAVASMVQLLKQIWSRSCARWICKDFLMSNGQIWSSRRKIMGTYSKQCGQFFRRGEGDSGLGTCPVSATISNVRALACACMYDNDQMHMYLQIRQCEYHKLL